MTAPHVIDLDAVRLRKQATVILQVANVRADAEVHRQIGVTDALTFAELHRILAVCFALPDEGAPWHFFQHGDARGERIDPDHTLAEFLRRPGDQVDYAWGLWDFQLMVADTYPRDADTPRALCVGGSGSFGRPFDITAVNAALTGRKTITAVLDQAAPPVRDLVQRTKLYDFVPLLQAIDLGREVQLPPAADAALATLPREVTEEGRDAFWAAVLALSCLADEELMDSIMETVLEALGWADDDGSPLNADAARELCAASLSVLADVGACGPHQKAPVDRLDIFRALLRR